MTARTADLVFAGVFGSLAWLFMGKMASDILLSAIAKYLKKRGGNVSDERMKHYHWGIVILGPIWWTIGAAAVVALACFGIYIVFSKGHATKFLSFCWNGLKGLNPFKYVRPDELKEPEPPEPLIVFGPDHDETNPNCNCMRCH